MQAYTEGGTQRDTERHTETHRDTQSTERYRQRDTDTELHRRRAAQTQCKTRAKDILGNLPTKAKPVAGLAMDLAKECLDKISAAHEAAEAKPVHVPLFGNTGAGKSTLLNAVLCQERPELGLV